MIIPVIEHGIERLLRTVLPLPETVGDVSFDPPSGSWSAQLSRLTVDVFLFGLGRSAQPARPTPDRLGADGRAERRRPLPMVDLNYLVSAYAGSVRDEHQLLSDVFTCFVAHPVLPAEHLPEAFEAPVQIQLVGRDATRIKDVWSGVGGSLRPAFEIVVTTPLDGMPWEALPPSVERVEALLAPVPRTEG